MKTNQPTIQNQAEIRFGKRLQRPQDFIKRTILGASALLMFTMSSAALSAPVNSVFTYHQPDSSTLKVKVVGDEFFAEETTLDGRRIIQDPTTKFWCYARLSADGKALESTGIVATENTRNAASAGAMDGHLRIKTPKEHRTRIDKANRERMGRDANGRLVTQTQSATGTSLDGTPVNSVTTRSVGHTTLGTKRGVTLLIRFPDRLGDATISTTQVNNFLNQTSTHYTEFGNNGSVSEFFSEVSNGKLSYTNTVTNYYTTRNPRSYYTDESVSRAQELVKEALNALEAANFDFRTLDVDGDGNIDAVNVFYAGSTVNAWSKGLWPHMGGISWSSSKTGKRATAYQMTDMGSKLELGTFCHENGHLIGGFPDVYDYDGDSAGGAGRYCLMNAGSFGTNPSPPNAYLRYKAGWGTAETINSSTNATKSLTAESNGRLANQFLAYFNPANNKEYYIIENRYKNDRDAGLPTGGIAVWHVDEQGNHNNQSYAHQSSHNNYEIVLIQADNQRHFERNSNSGDANDLYYAGGVSSQFSDTSDTGPYDNNAHWWSGSYSGMKLSGFSAQGNVMSLTVGQPTGGGGGGPAGYTKAANEGGTFNLPGTSDVAYGANGKFYYKYGVTGTIAFNNATFGDPIPGTVKSGYYKLAGSATYVIRARHSGKVLDVAGASSSDGGNVLQWTYGGGSNQQWKLLDAGGGNYYISAKHSGKVLDVAGVSSADGANVYQWTNVGGANQQWKLQATGDGYYSISAKHSGKCLDVEGYSTADGANVHQWACHGGTNQHWKLEKIN